jgi:hypothetical protein
MIGIDEPLPETHNGVEHCPVCDYALSGPGNWGCTYSGHAERVYRETEERTYRAVNGHLMVNVFYVDNGSAAQSSAYAWCAEECDHTESGPPPEDW